MHKKKSLRIYTSTHSGGLELTKLTYSRHEDNLIRDRLGLGLGIEVVPNQFVTVNTPVIPELSGAGIEGVPNVPKCRVLVLRS